MERRLTGCFATDRRRLVSWCTAAVAAGLALGTAGCAGGARAPDRVPWDEPGVVKVAESDAGKPVVLARGQLLEVRLRAYAAQGIQIKLGSILAPTLSQAGNPIFYDDGERQELAGGTFPHELWRFRAEQPGQTRLRLDYRRAWEGTGPPFRSVVFDVTVR